MASGTFKGVWVGRRRGWFDLPFVPLYAWLWDKCRKRLWKRSPGNGDGEPVALVDGLLLSFYYVLCERIGEA
jgi:hypothetical protein